MIGFFLWAVAVALTDKHAPLSAITFDFTGNVDTTVDTTVASFIFLSGVQYFLYFHFV